MNEAVLENAKLSFWQEVEQQRFDDHRFYHQSRINQSLHLLSALTFLTTYVLIPINPFVASILGWVVAMWVRQIGHFFFEPQGFDRINNVTFKHKEDVKVGFNLQRKVILLVVWGLVPAVLWLSPTFFGRLPAFENTSVFLDRLGNAWLILAAAGLLARTVYLCLFRGLQTGLAWMTKILTDPFNDIKTYWKSPYFLFKGQWLDPMENVEKLVAESLSKNRNGNSGEHQ